MKNKELIKEIRKKFNNYEIGYIKDRYISELDLMLHFGISTIIYYLVLLLIFQLRNPTYYPVGVVILLLIVYMLYNGLNNYIYYKAPLKNKWKNIEINYEDKRTISKRMKTQLIAFIAIVLFFGTSQIYLNFLYILGILFTIVVFIKIYLLYKNEKNYITKIQSDKK